MYRGILKVDCPGCEHRTDNEVIAELECLSPLSTVVYLRICILHRLLCKSNYTLLVILAEAYKKNDSWLRTVHEDLERLARVDSRLEEMRDSTVRQWVELIWGRPKAFMKLIKEVISREDVNKVAFWWPSAGNKSKNSSDKCSGSELQCAPITTFECPNCSYVCGTPQAFSWHMYDKHHVRHRLRACIYSTVCEVCLRDFHSRERVCTHITASSRIRGQHYREFGVPMGDKALERLESEAYEHTKGLAKRGRRRTFAGGKPPVRTYGPLLESACRLGIRHDCLTKVPPLRTSNNEDTGEQV